MKGGSKLGCIALAISTVGALNWGLVGLFNFNLVTALLGTWPMLVTLVYVLVGVSAVYTAFTHMGECKVCSKK